MPLVSRWRARGPICITLSSIEKFIAGFGLLVAIAMGLMKVVPAVPGHFTMYEWIALAAWIAVGVLASLSRTRRTEIEVVAQR